MAGAQRAQKLENFNFRLDAELKSSFAAAAEAEDRPAAQVLREFMRGYVEARERQAAFLAEARRSSLAVAAAGMDPDGDEAQIQREIEANFADQIRDEPEY